MRITLLQCLLTLSHVRIFPEKSERDLPLYRMITAYDAEGGWFDEYDQKGRI